MYEDVAAVKDENLKHVPIKHVLVGSDDVLYSFINRVKVPVSDDDLGLTSVWIPYKSGATGTDGYFEYPVLGKVETSHFAIYPDERTFG